LNENPGDELVDLFDVSADDLGESAVRKLMGLQDRVLTTTRLALSPEDSRKPVPRGDNWLEHQVLMGWKRYFKLLTRKHVVLTDEGAAVLGKGYENRAQTEFEIDDDAIYKAFGDGGSERIDWKNKRDARNRRRTAGYIVYLKELWQDGPDCLSMFGMSGPITYGFAWAVYSSCAAELAFTHSELVFVEITSTKPWIVSPILEGQPGYWKKWSLDWHRLGRAAPKTYEIPALLPQH
jgi:hypothetical protein